MFAAQHPTRKQRGFAQGHIHKSRKYAGYLADSGRSVAQDASIRPKTWADLPHSTKIEGAKIPRKKMVGAQNGSTCLSLRHFGGGPARCALQFGTPNSRQQRDRRVGISNIAASPANAPRCDGFGHFWDVFVAHFWRKPKQPTTTKRRNLCPVEGRERPIGRHMCRGFSHLVSGAYVIWLYCRSGPTGPSCTMASRLCAAGAPTRDVRDERCHDSMPGDTPPLHASVAHV